LSDRDGYAVQQKNTFPSRGERIRLRSIRQNLVIFAQVNHGYYPAIPK